MSKNVNVDIVRLGMGHSLILSNLPEKVQLEVLNKAILASNSADTQAFGLFESSQPNYTTYYPDVTAEDLKPKDEDFINPIFRALSEVIVHKKFNPIDFGRNDILRPSMKLLQGQTVNVDHETALGNAVGAVADVEWQDSYTTANKVVIPAGINSQLKIDGKSNPRIARGIQQDPPSIHSTSVTVEFLWEPSHPKMDRSEFMSKLGTFDDKGELVRRIVTKVVRYHEISLVSHGADPFAQLIRPDGTINNPRYADISYNSEAEKKIGLGYFYIDFKKLGMPDYSDIVANNDYTILKELDNIQPESNTQKTTKTMNRTLFLQLCAGIGLSISLAEGTEPTEEQLAQLTTALNAKIQKGKEDAAALAQQHTAQTERLTALEAFQTKRTDELRAEVTRLCGLLNNNSIPEPVRENLAAANYEALVILQNTYQTQLEESMPLSCTACGSKEVTRASSKPGEPEGGEKGKEKGKEQKALSAQETRQKLATYNTGANKIHGVEE